MAIRVTLNDGKEIDCHQVAVRCVISASGWIPVEGTSPEDTYAGEEIVVIIEGTADSIADDNTVTLQMRKRDGSMISRQLNLTKLFDLVRDHVDEHGDVYDEEDDLA